MQAPLLRINNVYYITASVNYRYVWHKRDGIGGSASGFNTRIGVSLE